jgi:predicted small secreted protein
MESQEDGPMPTADRRFQRRFSPRSLVIVSLLIAAFALAACGSAAGIFQNVGDNLQGGGEAPAPGVDTGSGYSGDKGSGDQAGSLADQRIIKTGEISLEVPNVTTALAQVRAMALDLGGYVGGSEAGTRDEPATLTLRIPADTFEKALARLHALDGDVVVEATQEQNVTSTVVDLEARIANLQASETQYRTLLGQAAKIEDILAVQTRLDDVRGQIEQLQAQHKELTGLEDLSTLTVTLIPSALQQAAGRWDPGKTVADAFAALVDVGQNVGDGAIWFAVVWLPVLIGLAVVVLLVWRLVPGVRTLARREPKA